jgi:predicted nuclease of predicted toxin-antitoxin system
MALRFFADHCVPRAVQTSLASAGHEVLALKDHLPTDAPDPSVIAKAQELDAVLLSVNGDFMDIVTYPPADYKGIIGLQVRNHPEVLPEIVRKLLEYLTAHPDPAHYEGKLFLVEPHRIRVRT